MRALAAEQTTEYLAVLQRLRSSHAFYDMHVHPYEVLFDRFTYQDGLPGAGVVSLTGKPYTHPGLKAFTFPELGDFSDDPKAQKLQDISVMLLRKVYGNVGEKVFTDEMELSGIDRVLLLPVAAESGTPNDFDSRMRWVKQFYRDGEKFWIAGSVPGSLAAGELLSYVRGQKSEHGIRAVKCHPVVSGIDLSSSARKAWLEELLVACHDAALPLIIHCGRNNPYWGGKRGDFAALENLVNINMSLSAKPVVLAHAGFHRCKTRDIETAGLSMLDRMLQAHPNLYVDISGLTLEPLKLVLRFVNGERILFGSDALYSSQWGAVTITMHALQELGMSLEDNFIKYASINPKKTIFEDQEPC